MEFYLYGFAIIFLVILGTLAKLVSGVSKLKIIRATLLLNNRV
jgi:hypothetical protein